MSFYSDLATTAKNLIADKGQSLPLKRIAKDFDPVDGSVSNPTKQEASISAVVVPFSSSDRNMLEERLVNDLTKGHLRKLLVAAEGLTLVPEPSDIVTFESRDWIVEASKPLNPAGTPLIYYVIINKGALSPTDAAAV